jgi:hypothetical protein
MMRERRHRSSFAVSFCRLAVVVMGAACTTISLGAVAPREASASVSVAASLEDLARSSTVIARVTAQDRESAWEGGRIVTYNRVRIDAVIAGRAPAAARELRVRTLGGRVGDIGQIVEGEAAFLPGETSLAFLTPMASPTAEATPKVVVVGRAQGQLVVRRDVHGREIVRVGAVGELVDKRVRPPLKPAGRRVVELDGAPLDSVALDAKQIFEDVHAP